MSIIKKIGKIGWDVFLWRVAWFIPAMASRALFCAMIGIFNLSWAEAVEAWESTG